MRYGFDESGGFFFPDSGFDSCAIAAVACPDSSLSVLDSMVAEFSRSAGLGEMHAAKMPEPLLKQACALIGASDVTWATVYTDTRLLPVRQQESFRRRQVKKADEGIAAAETLKNDPQRAAQATQARNRILHSTRVGIAEYLEFLMLFPRAFGDIVAASLRAYRDARWMSDFARLRFESDRKLTTKLSMGEKTLRAALPRFLSHNDQFRSISQPSGARAIRS